MKILFFVSFIFTGLIPADPLAAWDILEKVKFSPVFFKEFNEQFLVPQFDAKIKAYEGKEMIFKGYYMPIDLEDSRTIILSKFPYSQCFFCGGAGPESVVEVVFPSKHPRFKADQIITVKGTMTLNDKDINHMNFILKNATIVIQ
jgi:hypothetical protein